MKERERAFLIDKEKASSAILEYCENNSLCRADMSRAMHYCSNALSNALRLGKMSNVMCKRLHETYGFTKEQFVPGPEPKKKEEPVVEVEVEVEKPLSQSSIANEAMMAKFDELISAVNETNENLKKVVSITPSSVDVQIAVRDAMKEFKSLMWKDLLKDLRGCIFSANLEASKKHDETMVWGGVKND